jgi:hypothetical protein
MATTCLNNYPLVVLCSLDPKHHWGVVCLPGSSPHFMRWTKMFIEHEEFLYIYAKEIKHDMISSPMHVVLKQKFITKSSK